MNLDKLKLYKTAYSIQHSAYVRINSVHTDSNGDYIIDTLMRTESGRDRPMKFFVYELIKFCL